MAQRSKHYDWFQGRDNKKSPKENFRTNAKTTWKFVKIFLYFSLFFFSMWGCVQVFTHRISTNPADGITFSNGDANLSPQARKFTFLSDKDDNLILRRASNIYMSPKKPDEKKVITNLNRQLKDDLGVNSPTNARKGGNYVIVLQDQSGDYIGARQGVAFAASHSGSEADLKTLIYTTAGFNNSKKAKKYYQLENSFRILSQVAPNGIRFNSYSINKDKQFVIGDLHSIRISELENKYSKLQADGSFSARQELAFYFNVNLFRALFKRVNSQGKTFSFESKTYAKGTILNENEQKTFLKQYKNVHFFLNLIISSGSNQATNNIKLSSYPFGFSRDTNWIPITTWGKAWDKDGGTGPFYGIFVFPIAYMTNEIINALPDLAGWESLITIIIIVVTLSFLMFALNFKNTLQQTKIQELAAKKAVIDAKYAPYKGNKQMENRQRQEVAMLYKKEGISPLAQIGSLFLRMPFFLAMWRVIGSIDHIKTTEWLGINFATTSWRALFGNLTQWYNGWAYFPLILTAVGSQLFSTMLPRILTKRRNRNRMNVQQKEAMKKSDRTQKIMMVVTLFFPLITSAGVQVYFIIRSAWTIFEQLITHQLLVKRKKRQVANAIR